jgi:hypothetical protein
VVHRGSSLRVRLHVYDLVYDSAYDSVHDIFGQRFVHNSNLRDRFFREHP